VPPNLSRAAPDLLGAASDQLRAAANQLRAAADLPRARRRPAARHPTCRAPPMPLGAI
jgi:hypothetical protein